MFAGAEVGMMAAVARSSGTPTAPQVAPAVRSTTSGWRDPRLWVGVAIVAVSVVAGARLLAGADDTVQVWSVAADMGAGDRITEADLVADRVRFADDEQLGGYYPVDEELPADLELTRGVGAGELLPRGAVGDAGASGTLELPISVEAQQVPPGVGPGSVVHVYLLAPAGEPGAAQPAARVEPALADVTVLDAPAGEASFTAAGTRQLVLAVAEDDVARFLEQLGSTEAPTIMVAKRS